MTASGGSRRKPRVYCARGGAGYGIERGRRRWSAGLRDSGARLGEALRPRRMVGHVRKRLDAVCLGSFIKMKAFNM